MLTVRELRRFRDNLLAKKLRPSSVNRISTALRAALNLAADQDQRINNQTAWRIGLTTIFDAGQARNVILSDQVIRNIITLPPLVWAASWGCWLKQRRSLAHGCRR